MTTGSRMELAQLVPLPKRKLWDTRGASGPWIDYLCATYPAWAVNSDRTLASRSGWPPGLEPERTPIFAHNQQYIEAPPNVVFRELCAARNWPTYYENASSVELPEGAEQLTPGLAFRFRTFGTTFQARVVEYETNRRLAWSCEGSFPRIHVHHRWSLEAQGGGTCVVTEETNVVGTLRWFGPIHRRLNSLLASSGVNLALHAAHERWLTALKAHIESRTND